MFDALVIKTITQERNGESLFEVPKLSSQDQHENRTVAQCSTLLYVSSQDSEYSVVHPPATETVQWTWRSCAEVDVKLSLTSWFCSFSLCSNAKVAWMTLRRTRVPIHRQRESKDPGQGRHLARPAVSGFRTQATQGLQDVVGLRHPQVEHPAPGVANQSRPV